MGNRLVVISFSGALHGIKRGELTEARLNKALFYLGCTREYAFEPWKPNPDGKVFNDLQFVSDDKAEQERVHGIMVRALRKAEAEGRITWRTLDEHNSYEALNAMLEKNGIRPIDFAKFDQPYYNYPTVVQAAEVSGQPLEIFWRPTR